MDIEAGICRIRRNIQVEGYYQNRVKQALTSDTAKNIGRVALAVAAIAAVAYGAHSIGRRGGYDKGYSEGWDGGFIVGDFVGRVTGWRTL